MIFLDIDGVLNRSEAHPNGYCGMHPDCVRAFNRVVRKTDPAIVVSSAWRYLMIEGQMTPLGFASLLMTHGVDAFGRVLSHTTRDAERYADRGKQIKQWLDTFGPVVSYVVLDNGGTTPDGEWTDLGIAAAGHPFVCTDGEVGLTEADADKAIAILCRRPA